MKPYEEQDEDDETDNEKEEDTIILPLHIKPIQGDGFDDIKKYSKSKHFTEGMFIENSELNIPLLQKVFKKLTIQHFNIYHDICVQKNKCYTLKNKKWYKTTKRDYSCSLFVSFLLNFKLFDHVNEIQQNELITFIENIITKQLDELI